MPHVSAASAANECRKCRSAAFALQGCLLGGRCRGDTDSDTRARLEALRSACTQKELACDFFVEMLVCHIIHRWKEQAENC